MTDPTPIARLLRRRAAPAPEAPVDLPSLSPVLPPKKARPARDPKLPPPADLSGRPKLLVLLGPSAGKTTWARRHVSAWQESGLLAKALVAATNTDVVALERFLPPGTVNKPEDASLEAGMEMIGLLVAEAKAAEPPPVSLLDCAAGEKALLAYHQKHPGHLPGLRKAGVDPVFLWFWTPRVHDLALLKAFREAGLLPRASAMVLSEHLAHGDWDNYGPLRAQPVYQEALREGAAELWMPALEPRLANAIERRGIPFHLARDGKAPEVQGDDATATGLWLAASDAEEREAASWFRP